MLRCNKGVGFIVLFMKRKSTVFSVIRKCPKYLQQFHYTVKMTSNKHFPNVIYADHDAKVEKNFCLQQVAKKTTTKKHTDTQVQIDNR